MDQLYTAGARSLLLVNVPPVDRSPLTVSAGAAAQASEKSVIAAWNKNVTLLASQLQREHRDLSVFVFDANSLFTEVLDKPCSFVETCAYKNTTDYCVACEYSRAERIIKLTFDPDENGTPAMNTFIASCEYPVDEYFWLNTLHPTYRMQNVLAMEIANQLSAKQW